GIPMIAAVFSSAAVLALASSAAQQRDNNAFDALLRRYDADFDGRISRAEYPRSAAMFRRLDKDKDGFLSAADFGAAKAKVGAPAADAADPSQSMSAEQTEFFESKVRPLLVGSCYGCHSATAEKLRGEFRLDSREALLTGGPSGPALVPGNADDSLLVRAVRYTDDDLQMPPKRPLEAAQVAILEEWVRQGAPWPRASAPSAGAEVAVASAKQEYDFAKAREHWAFRPVEKRAPPQTKRTDWATSEIDGFLLAAMEERGVAPVADADRRTWLRRVTLDLTGLPPTPQELDAFEADKESGAHERVVDRLLSSSAYGERFGRHWLDVARYAESSGKDVNIAYPHAWRYRDYVIDAFAADKRYDEFLTEQLAGDLLPAASAAERAEHAVATGYLALGPKGHNTRDRRQFALDVADEQLDAVSGHARDDDRVRALPRPQVRRDPDRGLLLARRHLREHRHALRHVSQPGQRPSERARRAAGRRERARGTAADFGRAGRDRADPRSDRAARGARGEGSRGGARVQGRRERDRRRQARSGRARARAPPRAADRGARPAARALRRRRRFEREEPRRDGRGRRRRARHRGAAARRARQARRDRAARLPHGA
ncbi:MAG: DUF1549 domain-containing protein, partial [Planctomycetota bacterium]